jgi:hypothetical protein
LPTPKAGLLSGSEAEMSGSETSLEAPYDPSISICRVCQSLKLWKLCETLEWQKHHQSVAALRSSAKRCPSCKLILSAMHNFGSERRLRKLPITLLSTDSIYGKHELSISVSIQWYESKKVGNLGVFAERGRLVFQSRTSQFRKFSRLNLVYV